MQKSDDCTTRHRTIWENGKKTFLWRYRLFELYWFWTKIIWKFYQTGLTPPIQYKPGISVMVLWKSYKKGCTWLTATSDKVYQLLAHGRWFSPVTLASSTTNTGRHNIADILLKVALKHQKSNQSFAPLPRNCFFRRTQNSAFCCIMDIQSVQI